MCRREAGGSARGPGKPDRASQCRRPSATGIEPRKHRCAGRKQSSHRYPQSQLWRSSRAYFRTVRPLRSDCSPAEAGRKRRSYSHFFETHRFEHTLTFLKSPVSARQPREAFSVTAELSQAQAHRPFDARKAWGAALPGDSEENAPSPNQTSSLYTGERRKSVCAAASTTRISLVVKEFKCDD